MEGAYDNGGRNKNEKFNCDIGIVRKGIVFGKRDLSSTTMKKAGSGTEYDPNTSINSKIALLNKIINLDVSDLNDKQHSQIQQIAKAIEQSDNTHVGKDFLDVLATMSF